MGVDRYYGIMVDCLKGRMVGMDKSLIWEDWKNRPSDYDSLNRRTSITFRLAFYNETDFDSRTTEQQRNVSVPKLHCATFKMATPANVEADLWKMIKNFLQVRHFFCNRSSKKYNWNILGDICLKSGGSL